MSESARADTETLKRLLPLLVFARLRGLELKRVGKKYRCLCPLHAENTPSFFIDPARDLWNCFGCGRGGDVFNLVMELDGVDFKRAAATVREYTTTASPADAEEKGGEPAGNHRSFVDSDLQRHFRWILEHYAKNLRSSDRAQEYLEKRGVLHAEALEHVGAGYCDGGLSSLLPPSSSRAGREMRESLRFAGILNERGGERFRNCITFPLF